jgi:hypothetical protein
MEEKKKSKIIVIGFILFVLTIYSASYFYTKDKNEMLLSAPRLVLLIGSQEALNAEFRPLEISDRRNKIRSLAQLGLIQTISQEDYNDGDVDIIDRYRDVIQDNEYVTADCLSYSETLKRTMAKEAKVALKASWIFSACGIIE